MKTALKRLWDLTGTTVACCTVMAACLVSLGYSWHQLGQHHDLQAATDSVGYRFGVMTVLTALVVAMTAGVGLAALANRYRPRPLPVDPDMPPTKMVYLQGDGEPERCVCHGRLIEDGTEIWHWPQPAKLVCVTKDRVK